MKKFFIGLFVGLIALFGSIASVGSKSSFNNFNDFKMVQNALVLDNDDITFYIDNSFTPSNVTLGSTPICYLTTDSVLYYYDEDNNKIDFTELVVNYFEGEDLSEVYLSFYWSQNGTHGGFRLFCNSIGEEYIVGGYNNSWFFDNNGSGNVININGLSFNNITGLNDEDESNSIVSSYIGYLTSLPGDESVDPVPPSPPSQNFLDDITEIINGVINWFVDLFNGLADIFVIYDSNGSFAGFSLWGNVLFIEVSIMLVVIVLRWVISLIRGI